MKLNIGIVPHIGKKYNFFTNSVDINLLKFLNYCFKGCLTHVLVGQKVRLDLIVLSGSNTITSLSKKKADKIRNKIDKFYFNLAIKKKIPLIGICHGAQFIAKKYKATIKKSTNHAGKKYKIIFKNKKSLLVNSFHDYSIFKISKNLNTLAYSKNDKSIEYFEVKSKKIIGLMWHPERNIKFSSKDKSIFRSIL